LSYQHIIIIINHDNLRNCYSPGTNLFRLSLIIALFCFPFLFFSVYIWSFVFLALIKEQITQQIFNSHLIRKKKSESFFISEYTTIGTIWEYKIKLFFFSSFTKTKKLIREYKRKDVERNDMFSYIFINLTWWLTFLLVSLLYRFILIQKKSSNITYFSLSRNLYDTFVPN